MPQALSRSENETMAKLTAPPTMEEYDDGDDDSLPSYSGYYSERSGRRRRGGGGESCATTDSSTPDTKSMSRWNKEYGSDMNQRGEGDGGVVGDNNNVPWWQFNRRASAPTAARVVAREYHDNRESIHRAEQRNNTEERGGPWWQINRRSTIGGGSSGDATNENYNGNHNRNDTQSADNQSNWWGIGQKETRNNANCSFDDGNPIDKSDKSRGDASGESASGMIIGFGSQNSLCSSDEEEDVRLPIVTATEEGDTCSNTTTPRHQGEGEENTDEDYIHTWCSDGSEDFGERSEGGDVNQSQRSSDDELRIFGHEQISLKESRPRDSRWVQKSQEDVGGLDQSDNTQFDSVCTDVQQSERSQESMGLASPVWSVASDMNEIDDDDNVDDTNIETMDNEDGGSVEEEIIGGLDTSNQTSRQTDLSNMNAVARGMFPDEGSNNNNNNCSNAEDAVWDTAKLCEIKEGVSLSKVHLHDDVSSIASSEHSGRVPILKRSIFGWRQRSIRFNEERYEGRNGGSAAAAGGGGGVSFGTTSECGHSSAGLSSATETNTGFESIHAGSAHSVQPLNDKQQNKDKRRLSMMKGKSFKVSLRSSIAFTKSDSGVATAGSNVGEDSLAMTRSHEDEDYWLEDEYFKEDDVRCEGITKEACELMESVNKSTVSMGMEAPFRPVDEMFPPLKKLHMNIGYQMDSLQASTGNPKSVLKRARKLRKSMKKSVASLSSSFSDSIQSSMIGGSGSAPDHKALTSYIIDQLMQSQQQQQSTELSDPSLLNLYKCFLPNYLYYQPPDPTMSMIRPTSLCSGTGINLNEQYLQPDMLKVFRMFGSYFSGAGHLFQEGDDEDDEEGGDSDLPSLKKSTVMAKKNSNRRSVFWVETIEEIDEDDLSESESSNDSRDSDDSSTSSSGSSSTSRYNESHQIIERVIQDLRASQMMMVEQPKQPKVRPSFTIKDKQESFEPSEDKSDMGWM